MAADVFKARLAAQTGLIRKPEFDSRLKKISDRITKNKSKHLLVENELKKLKTLDSSYFLGTNYFEGNDGAQNSLALEKSILKIILVVIALKLKYGNQKVYLANR